MKRFLIRLLLWILRLFLKIAKVFSLKKLESFLTDYLKDKPEDTPEEVPASRTSLVKGVSKRNVVASGQITKNLPHREPAESPEEKEEELEEQDVIASRPSSEDKSSSVMPTILVAGAAVAAGVGIASIVRDEKKTEKQDLSDVEFDASKTYEELFLEGFNEKTGTKLGSVQTSEPKTSSGNWFTKLITSFGTEEGTVRADVIPASEYLKYSATSRVGQPIDVLKGYTYSKKAQSIGITTPGGAKMRTINEIIIHCTATPEGREVSLQELHNWHTARGFIGIGYHYVIHLDGTIEAARPLYMIGAHCEGHNAHSIGISYVGGIIGRDKPKDTRTSAQRTQIWNLVLYLLRYFPSATIHGHYEYANKACPCFNVRKEWDEIRLGRSSQGRIIHLADADVYTEESYEHHSNENAQAVDKKIVKTNG